MEKFFEESRCGLRRRNAEKEHKCDEYFISKSAFTELRKDQEKYVKYLESYKGDVIDILNKIAEEKNVMEDMFKGLMQQELFGKLLVQTPEIDEDDLFFVIDKICKTEIDIYDIAIWIFDKYGEDYLPRLFETREISEELEKRLKSKFF